MAITPGQLQFRTNGLIMLNGRLGNLFGNAYTNGPTSYAWLEVWNRNPTLTLSGVKAWIKVDPRGASLAIAYDSTNGVIIQSAVFDTTDPTSLTYTAPTTAASGITIPNLAPDQKFRLGVRRILSGSKPVSPESNQIMVTGTSPL